MSDILVAGKRPASSWLAPGTSLLKRSRPQPSASAACAPEEDIEEVPEADIQEEPEAVQAPVMLSRPVRLAPRPGQVALQGHMGGLPVEVAGMFAGATIHGGVNVHIHYGNVASSAQHHQTQVNLSQSPGGSPVVPRALD